MSESQVPVADLPDERGAVCACGAAFTQKRFRTLYLPNECESCGAKIKREKLASRQAPLPINREVARLERGGRDAVPFDAEAADADREAREHQELVQSRLRGLAVPPLYAGVSLESFEIFGDDAEQRQHGRILQLARRYVACWPDRDDLASIFPQLVILRGGTGTGKGHLVWSIAKTVVREYAATARVVKCADLVRDLRASWGRQGRGEEMGEREADRLKFWRGLDLLVIDEVSRHALMGEPVQHLYDVIDHRQEWLRPTIVTSNEEAGGIAELLGPAIVSRATAWSGVWQTGDRDYRPLRRERMNAPRKDAA